MNLLFLLGQQLGLGQQAVSKNNSNVQIDSLSNEMLLKVFGYLSPEDLAQAAQVCRLWRIITNDESLWVPFNQKLQNSYPNFRIIDASIWKKNVNLEAFGLEVEDNVHRAVLYKFSVEALEELYPSIENDSGITLLTIPRGLTKDMVQKLNNLDLYREEVAKRRHLSLGQRNITYAPAPKTYQIIITNSLLKESRKLSDVDQAKLLDETRCELPKVLEYATLVTVTKLFNSIDLTRDHTLTYCSEKLHGINMVAGSYYASSFCEDFRNPRGVSSYGIAGVRKLKIA